MTEKKVSHINLRPSKFSGNFRSGLKLPVLDASAKKIVRDNCLPVVDQNAATFIATTTIEAVNRNQVKNYLHIKHQNHPRSRSRPKWNGSTFLATGTGLPIEKGIIGDHTIISNKIKVHDGERSSSKPIIITNNNDDSVIELLPSEEEGGGSGEDDESSCEESTPEVDAGGDISKSRKTTLKGDSHLETEINQRITSVYRSIENLERKRINFNNSIRAAARRRTISDGIKNKVNLSKLSVTGSATTVTSDVHEDESDGRRKSSRIIDVTRTYKKMFGLDPMKIIASSEDDSDMDENGGGGGDVRDPRKKTKKSIRKYLEQLVKEEEPRDLSAIMPTMSEKTFLTKLQRRESQLNKEINDMRNNLDVMNMKAERETKKAKADRNKDKNFNKRLNVTKLMASGPDKGPARELTDYLQATGGSSGGWEIEDHMVFLRALRKWYARPVKLVDSLCQLLPNKKPEEIVKHIEWQEKFEKLSNANRDHIRQWQINRRREREIVYQMASESQKARLENEKRHQDLIRYRRAEERDKNHHRLSEWKRSKARERCTMKGVDADKEDDKGLNNSEKIAKMDLEMTNVRKEVREITAMTRDIGKSLQSITKTNPSDSSKTNSRITRKENVGYREQQRGGGGRHIKTASEASSGFCEIELGLSDGENYFRSSSVESRTRTSSTKSTNFYSTAVLQRNSARVTETKKMLKEFRNRDEEMIEAKKKAILEKKKSSRNQAFLTDKQVKERMKKITVPSKLMCPTKGWMIRKEIVEQEKIENKNRDRDEGANVWTSDSKDNFLPSYVNNIPKLGTPSWRNTTAR